MDANSGPESSGTGLKSGSAYDLLDLVTLAPLNILLCFFREIKIHIPLPLEDAWDEDKEPRDEDEDMDNVEADKTFNWDSN